MWSKGCRLWHAPRNVAPKAPCKTTPKPDDKLDRYQILSYEAEQEMIKPFWLKFDGSRTVVAPFS